MLLPDGSRNPESMPYGRSTGGSVNSTPRALSSSYEAWQSSVARNTVPAKPFATRLRTWSPVAASITGGPGTAISTIETSSWPGGPTVSQRKSPISGSVASERTSKPTLSRQKASASSWSCTQSCVVTILIMVVPFGWRVKWSRGKLRVTRTVVFSKSAPLRTGVEAHDAGGDPRLFGGRRVLLAIGGRRHAVCAREAAREGADALEPDVEADRRDRPVRAAQERRGALEPPREQVRVRRLPVRALELADEVRAREAGGARHVIDAHRLEVARVGEVLRAEEVAGGRDEGHAPIIAAAAARARAPRRGRPRRRTRTARLRRLPAAAARHRACGCRPAGRSPRARASATQAGASVAAASVGGRLG